MLANMKEFQHYQGSCMLISSFVMYDRYGQVVLASKGLKE